MQRPYNGVLCLQLGAAELVALDRHGLAKIDERGLDDLQPGHISHGRNGLMLHYMQAVLLIRELLHVGFGADEALGGRLRSAGRCAESKE